MEPINRFATLPGTRRSRRNVDQERHAGQRAAGKPWIHCASDAPRASSTHRGKGPASTVAATASGADAGATVFVVDDNLGVEIAAAMDVSVRTVEGHRRMVFLKTHVSSAAMLVRTVLSTR